MGAAYDSSCYLPDSISLDCNLQKILCRFIPTPYFPCGRATAFQSNHSTLPNKISEFHMLGTSSMRFHLHLRRCHPGFWGHVHGLPKGRPGKLSACINECIASSCFTYQWNHACRKYASKKDVMRQRRSVIRTGSTMVDAGSTLLPGFVFGQVGIY